MLDRIGVLMEGVRAVSNAIALESCARRLRVCAAGSAAGSKKRSAGDSASLRSAVERGIAELDGIIGVFQALLRIAEIEAGARRSAFAGFDAATVLADAADLYGAAAVKRGRAFLVDLPASLLMVGGVRCCCRQRRSCPTTRSSSPPQAGGYACRRSGAGRRWRSPSPNPAQGSRQENARA